MEEVLLDNYKSFDISQRVVCSTEIISLECVQPVTVRSVDVRDYVKARHRDAELGVFVGFVRYAGVRALRELSGQEILLKIICKAKEGKTDAEIERNLEQIIEDVRTGRVPVSISTVMMDGKSIRYLNRSSAILSKIAGG